MNRETTCCFTGHRPDKLPWGTHEDDPRCMALKQRLDAALRRTFPELPSWALRDAFTHRDVKVDGKRVKADLRVHGGEWVQVYVMEQSPALDVVYEDANLLLRMRGAALP